MASAALVMMFVLRAGVWFAGADGVDGAGLAGVDGVAGVGLVWFAGVPSVTVKVPIFSSTL